MAEKPPVHKRPSLGPLEKPSKKRFEIDPNTKVILKQVGIGLGIFSLVALLITGVYYGTRVSALTITTVTVSGGETIDAAVVRAAAERTLEGAYGALVPKRFAWFYPQSAMLAEVEKVDRIKDVVIERVSGTEVAITYGEYTPFALWCDRGPSEACLFLDERGYAFAPAPSLKGGSFVRYRSVETAPAVGSTVLSFDDFWSTVTFRTLLEAQGLFVRSVEVDSVRDVYYELVGGGQLRASLTQSPEEVVRNVQTIFASSKFAHLRADNFNYIDLRFGNKIYVNEVKGSEFAISSSTATSTDGAAVASTPAPDAHVLGVTQSELPANDEEDAPPVILELPIGN